jgi:CheY-like chemotaxis protein
VVIPPGTGSEGAAPEDVASAVAPLRRGRVLVIENEAAVANVLGAALSDEHDVAVVCSGSEALALLERDPAFDLVLCDLMMPDLTGVDVWNRVAECCPAVADRMVFVTGGAFSSREREFLDRTAVSVLEKPVDIGQLRELVRSRIA